MVEVWLKEVLVNDGVRLIGFAVTPIAVLHLRYLQDRVVLV